MDNHALPPWPAEVPAVCVGREERVGACWWPLHYGSSALTGSQTKGEKKKKKTPASSVRFHSSAQRICMLSFHITLPVFTLFKYKKYIIFSPTFPFPEVPVSSRSGVFKV